MRFILLISARFNIVVGSVMVVVVDLDAGVDEVGEQELDSERQHSDRGLEDVGLDANGNGN